MLQIKAIKWFIPTHPCSGVHWTTSDIIVPKLHRLLTIPLVLVNQGPNIWLAKNNFTHLNCSMQLKGLPNNVSVSRTLQP